MTKDKPMCCGEPMMATVRYKKFGEICRDFICVRCSNKKFGVKVPKSVYEECVR